ncbi:non-canonical purine NTP pyrophosphatase [Bdellovibrionota bacterium FG-2]
MRITQTLVLATNNSEKFEEFKTLFTGYPELHLTPASSLIANSEKLGFVEKHDTYLENAIAKARVVNRACHSPSLGDDSGLEVKSLGDLPGPRSRRFAPKAASGESKITQDRANLEHLLKEIKKAGGGTEAQFVCTLALVIEGILLHATGALEGNIIDLPRGVGGFGYDPVFVPKGMTKTLAEMTLNEKNLISHRAKALHALMSQVRARGISFAKP